MGLVEQGQLADGTTRLFKRDDPMLKRVDLAYAINTHMAQGITTERVMAVMQSWERNLSNMRSFLVNFTRQQADARTPPQRDRQLAHQRRDHVDV